MENLIENNKLIADFMGIEYQKGRYDHESGDFYFKVSELEYNHSWNWLVPVVEKIESLGYWTEIRSHKKGNRAVIGTQDNYDNPPIANVFRVDKIESVYNVTIEFIGWYNLNKNN